MTTPRTAPLNDVDPLIAEAIRHEQERLDQNIELIASENVVSRAVLEAMGSVLTNKYAEGYPRKRYYGGCVNMDVVEDLGLLKVDFLGLSTLTAMRLAAQLIEQRHSMHYDLDSIPLGDPESFALLTSGDVTGLFQVESAGMRRVLRNLKPESVEDIMAVIALYRPGPMQFIDEFIACRHGRKSPEYVHPSLAPILGDTFGVCVYQEQIIRILTDLAGYDTGEADQVRRAVSKKKQSELLQHRSGFVKGAMEVGGLSQEAADKVFDAFEFFANYGFNRAHAADYAALTCQTAYLKAHYPVEYTAASLTVERSNSEKVAGLISEARRLDIQVLPPDINHSAVEFTIEGDAIRFGLGAVKNVGEGAIELILEARREGGPFSSLDDLASRVDLRQLNKRVIECLIRAGALDSFGERGRMLDSLDSLVAVSQQIHQARQAGQMTMFDLGAGMAPPAAHFSADIAGPEAIPLKQRLAWERELLGVYLSEHPLYKWTDQLADLVTIYTSEVNEEAVGQVVTMVGVVQGVRRITTRKGDVMGVVNLEDLRGTVDVVVFPRTWRDTEDLWQEGKIVLVRGKVDSRQDAFQVVCESASDEIVRPELTQSPIEERSPMRLMVEIARSSDPERDGACLRRLWELAGTNQGRDELSVLVRDGERTTLRIDFPNARTRASDSVLGQIRSIPGATRCWVEPVYAGGRS